MAAAAIINCYLDTLDHPRSLLHGQKPVLKFNVNRITTFRDNYGHLKVLQIWLKMPIPAHISTYYPPPSASGSISNFGEIISNSHLDAINYLYNISRICRRAPSEPIQAKFGMSREVADVITSINFRVNKLRG